MEEFISINFLIFYLPLHTHNQSKTAKNLLSPRTPDAGWLASAMSRICIAWLAFSPLPAPAPRSSAGTLSFRTHSELTLVIYLEAMRSRKPLHGPHFSKAFTWSPGQRKLTYWDTEELGELRREKGLVLIFKHPFLPKQVSRTIFPPIRVLILTPEIYWDCIFGFVCGFATLS